MYEGDEYNCILYVFGPLTLEEWAEKYDNATTVANAFKRLIGQERVKIETVLSKSNNYYIEVTVDESNYNQPSC